MKIDITSTSLSTMTQAANRREKARAVVAAAHRGAAGRLRSIPKGTKPSERAFLESAGTWVDHFDRQNPAHKKISTEEVAARYLEQAKNEVVAVTPETLRFSPAQIARAREYGMEAQLSDPQHKTALAAAITRARRELIDFAGKYFGDNPTYSQAEAAAVVSVLLRKQFTYQPARADEQGPIVPEAVRSARLTADNQQTGTRFDGAIAAAAVENLRQGMPAKKAVAQALFTAGKTVIAQNKNGPGWKTFPQSSAEADARALMAGVQGCPGGWCTASSLTHAREQLGGGDFHVYYDAESVPRIAIRMADGEVLEVSGSLSNQHLQGEESQIAADKIRQDKLPGGEGILQDAQMLRLWQAFQAGQPPGTELLSFDQREKEPWSFATRRNNLRYGDTPLFAPTPEERERLKGHKFVLDENTVIGGDFITKEGDWKIKSVGGDASSYGASTQNIETVEGDASSCGASTQTIQSVNSYAYSTGASTQTIGSVRGYAYSYAVSTQNIESVGRYASSYDKSTQKIKSVDGDAVSRDTSTQTIESVVGNAMSHEASTQTIKSVSCGKSTQNIGAAAREAPGPDGPLTTQ